MSDKATTQPKLVEIRNETEKPASSVFDDLDSLRKQSKLTVQRKAVTVNVTVGKPPDHVYFRSNPDPAMQLDSSTVLKDRDNRGEFYFVTPGSTRSSTISAFCM
jgi:hypothetical protein